jgi:hypothetical protein
MICRELRSYFENPLLVEISPSSGASEVSQHVSACPECNAFMEAQKELAVSLRLAHQSVPELPASLDRAVLANYRHYVAQRQAAIPWGSLRNRFRPVSVLAWAAVLAASFLIAQEEMVLLFPANTAIVSPQIAAGPAVSPPPSPITGVTRGVATVKNPEKEQTFSSRRDGRVKASSIREPDALSPAFHSLLYCDPLSCEGAMEIIRVELPSSVLRSAQSSSEADMVAADVLVGSDGIARAIRIVE